MKQKKLQTEKKLALKKSQMSKINNLKVIKGGDQLLISETHTCTEPTTNN